MITIADGVFVGRGVLLPADRVHDRKRPAYGIATEGIPYFASGFICFALNITWIGYYQSIEWARKAMLFMLLRGIILMSLCFLVLPHLPGEKGLWLAVPCAELIIFIALTVDYQYRHKVCRTVE